MAMLFIPTDRIGLESFQPSISLTASTINSLLHQDKSVFWYTQPLRFPSTPMWPEGHTYQSGYAVADTEDNRKILDDNGLRWEPLDKLPDGSLKLRALKVAVYDGRGAGREFSDPLVEVLSMGGFDHAYIDDAQIRSGGLDAYDVLVVPGSPDAGECYYAGLGELGQEMIRRFIAERGHYLGVCGGAYLPLTSYNSKNRCWLDIVKATDCEDLDYWRTGSGFVRCRIDEDDHPIFSGMTAGATNSMNLVYWEGPAIEIKGGNVRQLAHFERLLASGREGLLPRWPLFDNTMADEAINNWYNPLSQELFDKLMAGRCAFAEAEYGGHKIIMYSPHPEMGNIGYGPRKDSLNFLLIFNGLFYLSACL